MANQERGEYPLMLYTGGSNGDGAEVEFVVRLTFNGSCDVTTRISKALGRPFSELDVLEALSQGIMHRNVLRHLLFESVRGQHGVNTIEDAGNLMGRNLTRIVIIARALARAVEDLFPEVYEGVEDEMRGNAVAPTGATSSD